MIRMPDNTIPGVFTKWRLTLILGLVCIIASGSGGNLIPTRAESSEVAIQKGKMIAPGVYEVSIRREGDMRKSITPETGSSVEAMAPNAGFVDPATVAGEQEWTAYLDDNFDTGLLRSTWSLETVGDGPWWDDWMCWSNSGPRSVGCAAGGEYAIPCGGAYPNNMNTWMVAGPFSFSDTRITAAVFECYLNLNCEENKDGFAMAVSSNGTDFQGYLYTGTAMGYVGIDLVESGVLGGVLGQPRVWVGLIFSSDESDNQGNGAQIDDVILAVDGLPVNAAPEVTVVTPNGGETVFAGTTQTITYVANDPDEGPEPLVISFDYSLNSGYEWTSIATGQENTGSYDWAVPDLDRDFVWIQVLAYDGDKEGSDDSDESFSVVPIPVENHLALGSAAGPSGTTVNVPLTLDNQDLVRGLQADIVFDGTKCFFTGIAGVGRGSGMLADGEQVDPDRARITLTHLPGEYLQAGTGQIAELKFTLQGGAGESTELALAEIVLSDSDGDSLGVDETPGSLEVQAPLAVPELQISVLKNPMRTRTVTILVRVANGSGSIPTVEAGGIEVPMTARGEAVYVGSYIAPSDMETLEILSWDENTMGQGIKTYTVSFP